VAGQCVAEPEEVAGDGVGGVGRIAPVLIPVNHQGGEGADEDGDMLG
jgi:hypothetical protein